MINQNQNKADYNRRIPVLLGAATRALGDADARHVRHKALVEKRADPGIAGRRLAGCRARPARVQQVRDQRARRRGLPRPSALHQAPEAWSRRPVLLSLIHISEPTRPY